MKRIYTDAAGVEWSTPQLSKNEPDCVEVGKVPGGGRLVRNSNDPDGPVVSYTESEWNAFIGSVRGGQFD